VLDRDKLSVSVSLILVGLALSRVVELPAGKGPVFLSLTVLGSPLRLELSKAWLVAPLLAGLACAGTDSILRSHPLSRGSTFAFWILPGLATLLAAIFLPWAPAWPYWLGGLALTGLFLPLVVVAEYHTVDPSDPRYNLARLGLNVAAYLIALVLFALIYRTRTRALLSATATLAGSGLLALELLRGTQQSLRRTGLHALIVGLIMGEVVWALNYWRMGSATAAMFLLLTFYVLTGLSQQAILGRFNRRVLLEFGLVALVGLALLLCFGP